MNRGYSYTPMEQPRSPPPRGRLLSQDSNRASSFRNQATVKQDLLNIDEFGDMDSDEDDFQALGSNFVSPKPPAKPQYNLVPYGFLRDDDELVEEDYDGVPIDDRVLQDSPRKQSWQSSSRKPPSEKIRGDPISILGSSNRHDSNLPVWPNDTRSQDRVPRNHQGLGSSSVNSNVIGISGSHQQLGAGRWDQKKASQNNSGNTKNILSLMGMDVRKEQNFVLSQDDANRVIQSSSRQTSSLNFVRVSNDTDPFIKASNKPISSGSTTSFVRGTNDSNPFIKTTNLHASSANATSFVPAKDISNSFLKSDSTPHWNAKPNIARSSTPAWAQHGRDSSQNLKGQVLSDQNQMFTPTNIANTTPQIELLQQAAALQQALTGLTQLGSQSGLNLLGAQNLLMQASQNPTLAAALVGTGLSSIQPNTSSNPSVECFGKFAITTAAPVTQSNVSVLKNPSRTNIIVNSSSSSHKVTMPDGSGATRYPAPDVSSLVFDPSTGYRFDASTGLHYDANSGYFFNRELKIYLRWDKFTQTYLRADNPPGVPRFSDSSTDRMSDVKGLSLASQNSGQQSSSFSNTPISKESIRSSNTFSTGGFAKERHHGLPSLMNVPTSSFQQERNTMHPSISTIPTDFSKPPPLSQPPLSDSRFQQSGANPVSAAEQKAAALPNFAETSLFNKLRKAKLAQTSQAKDRKRWGSPDPLFEAAQKHDVDTNKSQDDVLNLKELIQRSRQFMNQKTGKTLNKFDESADRQIQKCRSRSRSGDRRKNRSHSQSVGRPLRRSQSPARPGNRHGRSGMSPQPRRPLAKISDGRLREKPNSRGRSPNSKGRGRQSPSPAKKRSPINRARGRVSPSSKASRRRPTSRGRSPLKRRGKFSKSPDSRQKRPTSRGKSPVRRPRGRLSISPSLRKTIHHSLTPNRSQSPKVKVVLNQSPGGSKIQVPSPERNNKRSADRGLSAERRPIRRKLSPSCVKIPERTRACSPARKDIKDSVDNETGTGGRKSIKGRLGVRENKGESLEKDQIADLKPIPYETPQNSSKKPSGSNKSKDVSGFKSLSNLRNQAKEKIREKETDKKRDNSGQHNVKSSAGTVSTLVDLTLAADDETRSRANYRLVSERTFSSGWERKKPNSVSQVLSAKKTDNNTEARPSGKDTKEGFNEDEKKIEEPDEYDFDFLNDTLDDDNESTVIDEYEEILDYQDLEGLSEVLEKESASAGITKPDSQGVKKALIKESIGSPVIDLCIDSNEPAIEVSTSAESSIEVIRVQCSHAENSELAIPPGKPNCLGDRSVASQGEEEAGEEEGLELHDSEGLEVVTDSFSESVELSEPQSPKDNSSALEEKPEIPKVGICEKKGSSKSDVVPITQDETLEVTAQTKVVGGKLNAVDKATEIKKSPNNDVVKSKSGKHASDELEPEILENEEWNIVDSVDDQEQVNNACNVTKKTTSTEVNKSSSNNKKQDSTKLGRVETNESSDKLGTNLEAQSRVQVKDAKSNVTQKAAPTEIKVDGKNDGSGAQVCKGSTFNANPDSEARKEVKIDKPHLQSSKEAGKSEGVSSGSEREEPSQQVRSVSDIEKFLLLSSQEVEAKREKGIEVTDGKTEKKSGIFSRLGEKLPTDDVGDEPTIVAALPEQTSVLSQGPSKIVSLSAEGELRTAKPIDTSNTPNKSKNVDPEDPVGMLFNDNKPTSTIMIGPMNFIEPLQNFQPFTQKYIQLLLQQEKVKAKKVNVCHEDVTGAPYHYVLILFYSVQAASDWFKKHKGRFKFDKKVFKRVAGNTKQKYIPDAETYLHFSGNNWICKVCKKGNFPPRSLCFGCFQNKDPKGFSPVKILDKAQPPWKPSTCVGTPKLKFFVTKEKVLASAPPLDGFDIKRIEMIMDEKMGFPAGICVFEMANIIDAGKLKKYLNHREVEAVSVELHEKPNPESAKTGPTTVASKKTPPAKSMDERLHTSLLNKVVPVFVSDMHRRPSGEREGRSRYQEGRGMQERSPRFPSREVRAPKGRLPSPPWEVRVPRGRSPSISREIRVHRGRSPSPLGSRLSADRIRSRSPRLHSPGYQQRSSPRHFPQVYEEEGRSVRDLSRGRSIRELSPRYDIEDEPRRYRSRERVSGYGSPGYQSPPTRTYRSRSPVYDAPRRHSPSPRYRSPSPVRPTKPDGRGDWRYPPPDPTVFRFEARSGLDYDPSTTLYYEPKSCCFYNDDTNEWLEYDPRSGRYLLVR